MLRPMVDAGAPHPPLPADRPDGVCHSNASDAASHEGASAPVSGSRDSSECSVCPALPAPRSDLARLARAFDVRE
eukprot:871854-Alexandrium_andersonii.AAC.1